MSKKLEMLKTIGALYARSENVLQFLRDVENQEKATSEDILISYDFQAGSYTKGYQEDSTYRQNLARYLISIFESFGDFGSILEAGCGEATNLLELQDYFKKGIVCGGFDISWSRIKVGKEFCRTHSFKPTLFCGDLFNIPLQDKSVDVVYTSHSIEPNRGRETEAVLELARIAKKWLVLLEPAYEMANDEARDRMEKYGYIRNLKATILELGLHLERVELLSCSANPLNPKGLYLIRLDDKAPPASEFKFQCPITKTPLACHETAYYSAEGFLAYPILKDVPCLSENNAVLATKFEAF